MGVIGSGSSGADDFAQLDDNALRQQWRRTMRRQMPEVLGRQLILRILRYQEQVQLHGDLDNGIRRALAEALRSEHGSDKCSVKMAPAKVKQGRRRLLRPGTIVSREHGGVMHRVMVLDEGFAWNDKTYDSLSKVAFAITGTRWNGPRFFGLRDKSDEGGKRAGGPKRGALDKTPIDASKVYP